jgi:hypothetical protein
MLYILEDRTGKQHVFHIKAVAELFKQLRGGEIREIEAETAG